MCIHSIIGSLWWQKFYLKHRHGRSHIFGCYRKKECCIEKEFGAIGVRQTGCNNNGHIVLFRGIMETYVINMKRNIIWNIETKWNIYNSEYYKYNKVKMILVHWT